LISGKDTSVSSIWTPSGEHPTDPRDDSSPGSPAGRGAPDDSAGYDDEELTPEQIAEVEAEMFRARAELASVPVADIVANHAVGLWQLAVLHLTPDPGPDGVPPAPRLDDAGLAIDAFAALVEGLGDRLSPNDEALLDALTQLRLAFVQVSDRPFE
jgi:hypothetical protein